MSDANDWHWRNSMRPTRFFAFDSRAVLGILLVIIHMRKWTFILALVVIGIFWFAERAGYGFEAAFRRLRVLILGPRRPAVALRAKRRLVDYGR